MTYEEIKAELNDVYKETVKKRMKNFLQIRTVILY